MLKCEIKEYKMVWAWKSSAYKAFIGKQEGRRLFGGPRGTAEDNFKVDL
jgi:hypothetical protein